MMDRGVIRGLCFFFLVNERKQIKPANNKATILMKMNTETMPSAECAEIEMFWTVAIS